MNNENLKEAIGKYIESKELVLMAYPPECIDDVKKDMEIAFKAGAEWMARQGEDGLVLFAYASGKACIRTTYHGNGGDQVIVLIRKKEEKA